MGALFKWQSSEIVGESFFFFFFSFLGILTSLKTTMEIIHAFAEWNGDLFDQQLAVMVSCFAVSGSLEYCTLYYHPQCLLFMLRWMPNWESSGLFLGGWTSRINGDSSKAGLAEGGSNITADLPPVNNTQCQVRLLPPYLTQAWGFTVIRTVWSLYLISVKFLDNISTFYEFYGVFSLAFRYIHQEA